MIALITEGLVIHEISDGRGKLLSVAEKGHETLIEKENGVFSMAAHRDGLEFLSILQASNNASDIGLSSNGRINVRSEEIWKSLNLIFKGFS